MSDTAIAVAVSFRVQEFTPEGHATRLWGVVADYGWCDRILFSDAYEQDALDICADLANTIRFKRCQCKGEIAVSRRESDNDLRCDSCGGSAPSGTMVFTDDVHTGLIVDD